MDLDESPRIESRGQLCQAHVEQIGSSGRVDLGIVSSRLDAEDRRCLDRVNPLADPREEPRKRRLGERVARSLRRERPQGRERELAIGLVEGGRASPFRNDPRAGSTLGAGFRMAISHPETSIDTREPGSRGAPHPTRQIPDFRAACSPGWGLVAATKARPERESPPSSLCTPRTDRDQRAFQHG